MSRWGKRSRSVRPSAHEVRPDSKFRNMHFRPYAAYSPFADKAADEPDLPTCTWSGATYEEALASVLEALE